MSPSPSTPLEDLANPTDEARSSRRFLFRSLSTRALTLADEAAQEKRAMQIRLEAEIERLRAEMTKVRDDMDDQRARFVLSPLLPRPLTFCAPSHRTDLLSLSPSFVLSNREQGQGIALLDELNSLQDEVQTLRKQLRQKS